MRESIESAMRILTFLTEPYVRNFVGLWHSRVGLAAAVIVLVPAGIFALMRQSENGDPGFTAISLMVAVVCCATILIDVVQATSRHLVQRKMRRE